MNFDMLEMEVIRFADKNGLSGVLPKDAANFVAMQAENLIGNEQTDDLTTIKNSVGSIVVALIAYCDSRDITMTECLDVIVKRTKA